MRRPSWPLLLLPLWLGLPTPAPAHVAPLAALEDSGSHYPLPDLPRPGPEFEKDFLQRLNRARDLRQTNDLVRNLLNHQELLKQFKLDNDAMQQLRGLAPHLPELLANPEWQKLLQSLNQSGSNLPGKLQNHEFLKEFLAKNGKGLESVLKEWARNHAVRPGRPDFPRQRPGQPPPPRFAPPPRWPEPRKDPGGFPQPEASPRVAEQFKEFLNKSFSRMAQALEQMDAGEDGQALRDTLGLLPDLGGGEGLWNLSSLTPSQMETLEGVAHWLSPEQLGAIDWGKWAPNWGLHPPAMPSLPHVAMPSITGPSFRGLPSAPALPDLGSSHALVWMLLLVLLIVLLWKWNSWFPPQKNEPGSAWQLGPWPVAPDRVTTRGDLVQAFEYLALLLLGPTARTRHHHELAQQIERQAGEGPVHEAVEQLAHVYEQARYAPEQADATVPLSPQEQALARHTLCLLAGLNPA